MTTNRKEAVPISALRPNRYPATPVEARFGLSSLCFDFVGDLIAITDMNTGDLLLPIRLKVELNPSHGDGCRFEGFNAAPQLHGMELALEPLTLSRSQLKKLRPPHPRAHARP